MSLAEPRWAAGLATARSALACGKNRRWLRCPMRAGPLCGGASRSQRSPFRSSYWRLERSSVRHPNRARSTFVGWGGAAYGRCESQATIRPFLGVIGLRPSVPFCRQTEGATDDEPYRVVWSDFRPCCKPVCHARCCTKGSQRRRGARQAISREGVSVQASILPVRGSQFSDPSALRRYTPAYRSFV